MSKSQVVSVLMSVSIEKMEQELEAIYANCFCLEELTYLKERHVRMTAGWFALKQAVVKLIGRVNNEMIVEKDVVITKQSDGRPVIKRLNCPAINGSTLSVSISHSKTTAYGLAAMEEVANG